MKLFISFGVFMFALSVCGLSERLQKMTGGTTGSPTPSTSSSPSTGSDNVEKAKLNDQQESIIQSGDKAAWDAQGITFQLPKGWKKMDVKKEMFNYGSPDNAFLIASISVMANDFPSEISLKATYDSSLQQLKNGKYIRARYLEIDGIKGVEFVEAPPEDKDGPRRHQWIAFRNYQGQNQQMNIMLSTKGSNFEKHNDDFSAVMYSMKIGK